METETRKAARLLRDLLDLPDTRPASWEAAAVLNLEHELRAVLDLLTDGSDLTN